MFDRFTGTHASVSPSDIKDLYFDPCNVSRIPCSARACARRACDKYLTFTLRQSLLINLPPASGHVIVAT